MRKFLYSPGYGAGWSTWNIGPVGKYVLFYEPIIKFIENGGSFTDAEARAASSLTTPKGTVPHPLLEQLAAECKEKFNEDYVCILGADDLRVGTCGDEDQVSISEYDGSESYRTRSDDDGWY